MSRKIEPANRDDLLREYVAGSSENEIAKKAGVSRNVVARWLLEAGIDRRGQSDAERMKWATMSRIARRRQVRAANEAARGRVRSDAEVIRGAASNFAAQTRKGAYEDTVAAIARGFGFAVLQQHPVHRYNIDVALHELRVAVEVLSHYPYADSSVPYRERVEHLVDAGWRLLWIDCAQRRDFDPAIVGEHILAHANAARRNEPAGRRQWVIRCNGKPTPAIREHLHKLTGVPCTDGCDRGALD